MELNIGDLGQWKIQQIAASDPRKAELLRKYHLDYTFGEKHTLNQACKAGHVNLKEVVQGLKNINTAELPPSKNMNYWDVDFLCDYIERIHHEYIRKTHKYLEEDADLLCKNHGQKHEELGQLILILNNLFSKLLSHIIEEEKNLFPAIKKLASMYMHPELLNEVNAVVPSLIKPISLMSLEHEETGKMLHEIRQLTNNFRFPENVDLPYRIFYEKLMELEDDLMMHVHVENNILFPKALELSRKFDPEFG